MMLKQRIKQRKDVVGRWGMKGSKDVLGKEGEGGHYESGRIGRWPGKTRQVRWCFVSR